MSGGSFSRRAALNTTLTLTDDEERAMLAQVPAKERPTYAAWLAGERNSPPVIHLCAVCPGPATRTVQLGFGRSAPVCHLHWEIAGRLHKPTWRRRLGDLRQAGGHR